MRNQTDRGVTLLSLALALGGCQVNLALTSLVSVTCTTDDDCPTPQRCVAALQLCVQASAACIEEQGHALVPAADGNRCDAGEALGVCRGGLCQPSRCGDSIIDRELGEACDAGDNNSDTEADACRRNCHPASCGDGTTDRGEACDNGRQNSDVTADACRLSCGLPRCGDGIKDSDEACDNGLSNSDTAPNACREDCTQPRCGDNVQDSGEGCDDGDTKDDNDCTNSCLLPECGDGIVWSKGDGQESCDDDNTTTEVCAYGLQSCGVCNASCSIVAGETHYCGDGHIDVSNAEVCDDGDTDATDGCSSSCTVENNWHCEGEPSLCTHVYFVDQSASGSGTGASWIDAFVSLQDALFTAANATYAVELWVAAGVYYPDVGQFEFNDDRASTFRVADGVRIYGGFAGTETQRSQADPVAHPTVLSGDLKQDDVGTGIADNAYNVVTVNPSGATTRLDGMTIRAGNGNGLLNQSRGGGLFASSSQLTLSRISFSNNRGNWGGGAYFLNGAPVLDDCTFSNNVVVFVATSARGGGLFLNDSQATVRRAVFSNNQANNEAGALWISSATGTAAVIEDSTFSLNTTVGGHGGAVYVDSQARPTFRRSAFNTNQAGTSGLADGGAVYMAGSSGSVLHTRFEDCTFSGNSASNTGGALYGTGTDGFTMLRSVLSNNVAGSGGAIRVGGSAASPMTAFIADTDFRANRATSAAVNSGGGALAVAGTANVTVVNSAFVGNRASVAAGNGSGGGNHGHEPGWTELRHGDSRQLHIRRERNPRRAGWRRRVAARAC